MKFLVDECVGSGVAEWLSNQGHDVVSILEISPGISDNEVLHLAVTENRILITMDKDFGDIVFRNKRNHHGVILLRLNDWQLVTKVSALESLFAQHIHEISGNFVVLTERSIRVVRVKACCETYATGTPVNTNVL